MNQKTFTLEIVTPERSVFSGDVESVIAPSTEGYFQILYNHTPFLSTLQTGEIIMRRFGSDINIATSGGFAQVADNKMTILAETAEKAREIDVHRAEKAKERAEKRLEHPDRDIDIERARLALFRALNRLRIAQKR